MPESNPRATPPDPRPGERFQHGFFRAAAVAPEVWVANPQKNSGRIVEILREFDRDDDRVDLVVFPELAISGYTCGDLFANDTLLRTCREGLLSIAEATEQSRTTVVVGLPLRINDSLMNVAAVVSDGDVAGIVPKSFLPTYREFYEGRHFRAAGAADPDFVEVGGGEVPFGTDLLFTIGEAVIAVEICEDVWTPIPPSCYAAVAGANVLVNLSASNETIGKAGWRRDLVKSQSGRCIAGYVYASAGCGESSSDLVFGGHCMIAENGTLLRQSRRIGDGLQPEYVRETRVRCDLDLQRLSHDRCVVGSFDDVAEQLDHEFRRIDLFDGEASRPSPERPERYIDAHPFVPSERGALDDRCAEVLAIQSAGLVKRLECLPKSTPLSIGISGGLDSTLALLVSLRAVDAAGWSRKSIHGMTMPGFGTTEHTRKSADALIETTGITGECIDIREQCLAMFQSLRHRPLGFKLDAQTTVDSFQKEFNHSPDDAQ
ncbi:MAG: NAD(+) synthase, partial [Planctomycetota bacterium]